MCAGSTVSVSIALHVLSGTARERQAAPGDTAQLCFFGFQKIVSINLRKERGRKDFPNLPKKHAFGLGSGAHSRRFAQECPEGNPGKFNQEKLTWHFTKIV